MLATLLLCSLTLGAPNPLPTTHPAGVAMSRAQTPPKADMLRLFNDMGALLRRALAESNDAKALAMLQGTEAAQILKREQESEPVFAQWQRTLPTAERKALELQLQNNETGQFISSLSQDANTSARLQHNPKLKAAVALLLDGPLQELK